MRVRLVKIKGVEYELNLDTMRIKVFDRKNQLEVRKYLIHNLDQKKKFKLEKKYDRIYRRLEKIQQRKKKKSKK